jgi:polysaccharide pyruvyl transferase WcaK-like protein
MFGLKVDYRQVIYDIIDLLMKHNDVFVLLVPHVFPPKGFEVESDPEACRKAYDLTKDTYKKRILLADGKYNHNEIKYIIGLCDFFIGSRMHACIAAISQNIPTVCLAYSKKFEGALEGIGSEDCVVDICNCGEKEVRDKVELVFNRRNQIRNQLERIIPHVKENILGIFDDSIWQPN